MVSGKFIETRAYNARSPRRVFTINEESSRTDQQFKAECDVNNIMKKLRKGENVPLRQGVGVFADVSQIPDLLTCMDTLTRAQQDFDALPSDIRKRFGNSPVELVNFLDNPQNDDEAIKLGFKVRNPESLAMEMARKDQEKNITETKTKTKGAGDSVPSTKTPED